MDRLEIYPKSKDSFYAIPATKCDYSELEAELENWGDLSVELDSGELWVSNSADHTLLHIPSGYYFVVCGPFWDIMSSTEIMDDFRIG